MGVKMSDWNLIHGCFCSYLCALSFGIVIGYSSPALPDMINSGHLDESKGGWFGSIATIGAMLGCPIAGWCIEKFGRKISLFATNIPFVFGWLILIFGYKTNMLYTGRLLTGLGAGMTIVCSPLYIAEISKKESRGFMGSAVQLSVTLGILFIYTLGIWCSWRTLAWICVTIPIFTMLITLNIHDTPRYYLLNNDKGGALRSLHWLRGPTVDIEEECRDIEESIDSDDTPLSVRDFYQPQLLNPLKVGVGLMFFQQVTGINAVMFYATSIFSAAGMADSGAWNSVLLAAVQVIFTLAACVLMDRAGRRVLLIIPGVAMALSTLTLGWFYHRVQSGSPLPGAVAMCSLVVYIIAFALGWGPIPMLIMAEVFPVKARGIASGIVSLVNWSGAFVITNQFGNLQTVLGTDGAFWLFSMCCFVGVYFVWRRVPETKGKSLEDIELYFLGRAQLRVV